MYVRMLGPRLLDYLTICLSESIVIDYWLLVRHIDIKGRKPVPTN